MPMNSIIRALTSLILSCTLFATGSVGAIPIDLGYATGFNTFVLGDMTHQHSDVEGRLAVGGNLTLSDYAIGLLLSDTDNFTDSLVVGGELNFTRGRIHHGNAVSDGSATLTEVGFYTGDGADLKPISGAYRPDTALDTYFSAAAQDLLTRSSTYGGLTANGSIGKPLNNSHVLQLRGDDSGLNIFSLSMADLLVGRIDLIVPTDAWALINVSGKKGSFSRLGINFGDGSTGVDGRIPTDGRHDGELTGRVLFNFFEAMTLDVHGIAVSGSLLAPQAEVGFYNARIDGQLIAGSLTGTSGAKNCSSRNYKVCGGQSNWYPFMAVPTPGTLPLLLPVLLLLFLQRRAVGVSRRARGYPGRC